MSTQTTIADTKPETPSTPAAKPKKAPRSFSIALRGDEGQTLRVSAVRRKDGNAVTFVVVTTKVNGERKNQRGATEEHTSFDAAKAHVETLVKKAVALGWKRKTASRGFTPKPDAFTASSLPKPADVSAEKSAPPKAGKKK